MRDLEQLREEMIVRQLIARGIRDENVLQAMRGVPREEFVAPELVEFAYEDAPLPIDEGQTISQPYIVAVMTQAAGVTADSRVLDVGTGSGYAAAVLSRVAKEVYTIERHESLAHAAQKRFAKLGYDNIRVLVGDGTLGWAEHAPFDAIIVAAGGPKVPQPLIDQLALGGRLIIPTAAEPREQHLLLVQKVDDHKVTTQDLGQVRFVPLIGEEGWEEPGGTTMPPPRPVTLEKPDTLAGHIARAAEPFSSIDSADLEPLLARIGDARVVLLGEASHGTAEFYEMRARITKELIEKKGFHFVAVEADWPDAMRIGHYVRDTIAEPPLNKPFTRFPTWMWANQQVLDFVQWLRLYNQRGGTPHAPAGFYGLDLYSLYTSIAEVLRYLADVDPAMAAVARQRYGCLSPWEADPAAYGAAVLNRQVEGCEKDVVAMLHDIFRKQLAYAAHDGHRYLDAQQNARLIAGAEHYYRLMYYGSRKSWNLRDRHMFETLQNLLQFHGTGAKAVVWAHNSHLGDAAATEMSARGEFNVGHLCREFFGDKAYLVGFGTDHGTVAAASDWNGPMEIKQVRPAHPKSYERLCHDSGVGSFFLPLGATASQPMVKALLEPRLERAIGVIYRPETELQSHYFHAVLPEQFDEFIWFDETRAVDPLGPQAAQGMPDTFPFGV